MDNFSCPSCDTNAELHHNFCKDCGFDFATYLADCGSCGSKVDPQAKYCTSCGKLAKKGISFFSALLRFTFAAGVIVLFVSVLYRTDHKASALPTKISQIISEDQTLTDSLPDGADITFDEVSFKTLVFSGKTTHEAEILVPSPTNQLYMIQSAKDFLISKSKKIYEEDVFLITVYENTGQEKLLRANFIWFNKKYRSHTLPSKKYKQISDNLYVLWETKAKKSFW